VKQEIGEIFEMRSREEKTLVEKSNGRCNQQTV